MQIKNVVEGVHNKQAFRYEDGKLNMFERNWDKEDIKNLIEVANLLEIQGYKIKIPTGRQTKQRYDMFSGGTFNYDVKTYDEQSKE